MTRPQRGEMQTHYWCMGRIDLARTRNGWWITVWRTRPPAPDDRWQAMEATWYGDHLRVIRSIKLVEPA